MKLRCHILFKSTILFVLLTLSWCFHAQKSFSYYDSAFNENLNLDLTTAKMFLDKQFPIAKTQSQKGDFYVNKAIFMFRSNALDSSDFYNNLALTYFTKTDETKYCNYCKFKALTERKRFNFSSSTQIIIDGIKEYNLTSPACLTQLYNTVSGNLLSQEKYDSAKVVCFSIEKILKEENSDNLKKLRAHNLYSLGTTYQYLASYDSAIYYYDKGLSVVDKNDFLTIANGNSLIADILNENGDCNGSIDYYNSAIEILEKTENKIILVHGYYNISDAFKKCDLLDSTFVYLQYAYQLSSDINYPLIQAHSLQGLGDYYYLNQNQDSAVYYTQKSLHYFKLIGNNRGLVESYALLSKVHSESKAIEYARLARVHALKVGTLESDQVSLEAMYNVYLKMNIADSALYYFQLSQQIKDSIHSLKVQENIDKIEIQYASKLKEEENKVLKLVVLHKDAEVEKRAKEKAFWTYLTLLSILASIAIIGVLFFVLRLRKLKLRERDLELSHANKLREILYHKLEETKSKLVASDATIENLKEEKIIEGSQSSEALMDKIYDRADLTTFMIEFELIYVGFFDKVRLHSSENFTNNDLKLLTFVKLGLTNKEISEYSFISIDSVKKSKSRLFKKIELTDGFTKPADLIRSL